MPTIVPGEAFSPEYVAGMATIWVSRRFTGACCDSIADPDNLVKIEGNGNLQSTRQFDLKSSLDSPVGLCKTEGDEIGAIEQEDDQLS